MRTLHGLGDMEMVVGCINRDKAAWDTFIKKYRRLIFISARKRLLKYGFVMAEKDGEDIVQNILTSMWEKNKFTQIRECRDISWWVAVVSGNSAISYMRKKMASEPKDLIPLSSSPDEDGFELPIPSPGQGPHEISASNEITEQVKSAVELLSKNERIVAKLNLIHCKKYKEISEILNMPIGTVASHAKRAKESLKYHLSHLKDI